MRIRAKTNVAIGNPPTAFHEGEERDVSDAHGRELLATTHFERVGSEPVAIPETAVAPSRGERAVRPVPRAR